MCVCVSTDGGEWIHMFPEGTRSKNDSILQVKKGVGRLIAEPETTPVVLPFYHGIHDI